MAVTVVVKETGETIAGKFVVIEKDSIGLFSGIMSDKKGGFRGCGKKRVFDAVGVTVSTDNPEMELKQR